MDSIAYGQQGSYLSRAIPAAQPIRAGTPADRLDCGVDRILDDAKSQQCYDALLHLAYVRSRDGHHVMTGQDFVDDLERIITRELRLGVQIEAKDAAGRLMWGSAPAGRYDSTKLRDAVLAYEFVTGKPYDVLRAEGEARRTGAAAGAELSFMPV